MRCKSRNFRDGFGDTLEREDACLDASASVIVKIVDRCGGHMAQAQPEVRALRAQACALRGLTGGAQRTRVVRQSSPTLKLGPLSLLCSLPLAAATVPHSCPCVHANYYSNQRWCCGDMQRVDLGRAAFKKVGCWQRQEESNSLRRKMQGSMMMLFTGSAPTLSSGHLLPSPLPCLLAAG